MYIANTTKQIQVPNFRVPETRRVMQVPIPSGTQVEIGKVWNSYQTDAIVHQLERYGARNAKSFSGATIKHYSGLLYSLDKPISTDKIEAAHQNLVDEQVERSYKEMVKTALGIDAGQRERGSKKRLVKSTTLEIQEDSAPRTKLTGNEAKLKVTVTDEGHDDPGLD